MQLGYLFSNAGLAVALPAPKESPQVRQAGFWCRAKILSLDQNYKCLASRSPCQPEPWLKRVAKAG
jgi:hypothetical protein